MPLTRLAVLAPFGIWPVRSAGQEVVFAPAARLAADGVDVDLFTLGLRRFERRVPRPFVQTIARGLHEYRHLSLGLVLDRLVRGTARVPPLDFSARLRRAPAAFHAALRRADLVQLESPWAFEFASEPGRPRALVVHNHECALHATELARRGLLARAEEIEGRAWRECELVLVPHADEAAALERAFGAPRGRVLVLPFGIDVAARRVADDAGRRDARARLGLPATGLVGLFPASAHAPNRAAAAFLREVAPALQAAGVHVLIAGGVTAREERFVGGLATGPLPSLDVCFAAADLGLHPITEGRGMNVKLGQMLASGLPVLATQFGARGYDAEEKDGLRRVAKLEDFVPALRDWALAPAALRALGAAARAYAEAELDWGGITARRRSALEALLSD